MKRRSIFRLWSLVMCAAIPLGASSCAPTKTATKPQATQTSATAAKPATPQSPQSAQASQVAQAPQSAQSTTVPAPAQTSGSAPPLTGDAPKLPPDELDSLVAPL